ncbi:MAG: ThiF family adenylyltransferase [Planctomycetaceae bacterium]|nr:ThiF family adenylyltransferase [Planctomycetaceae bacterium]
MTIPPRYAKQALFAGIGSEGQAAIGRSRVVICGCGATGGVLAELLARAGVGFIRVVDRDFVERGNLQRQVLFDERDAAERTPKAIAAAARLRAINGEIEIAPVVADIGPENVLSLVESCDLILDGTDNFETRFLLNDASHETGIPWIYCGVIGGHGQTMTILPGATACLRCLIETPPEPGVVETCDTAGVIGPAVTGVASLAAAEAMKLLAGRRELIQPRLLVCDVWEGTVRSIDTTALRKRGTCPACDRGERPWLNAEVGSRAAILCGRKAVQITPADRCEVALSEMAERLAPTGQIVQTPYLLRLSMVEPACEITIFRDGRAIIQGTEDIATARALYARLIGL